MASISKRGDYQWEAQVRRRGFPSQSKTFISKAEAQTWASTIESEMARGVFVDRTEAERTTLKQLIDRYLKEVAIYHRGANIESSQLRAVLKDPLSQRFVATLNGSDFAKYRDSRLTGSAKQRQVKPGTIVKELQLLKRILHIAKREWAIHLPENAVSNIKFPRVKDARSRRLGSTEERFLLAAFELNERGADGVFSDGARNPWMRPILMLAIDTAMRRGEILGLLWRHVDLSRQVAHLPITKNGESRDVPLSTRAVAILEGLPRSLEERVFPVSEDSFKKCWQRGLQRAKEIYRLDCAKLGLVEDGNFLVNFRFHDCRHEATTRLAELVQNPMELARITGHKDLKMLLRYYNVTAEELARKLG